MCLKDDACVSYTDGGWEDLTIAHLGIITKRNTNTHETTNKHRDLEHTVLWWFKPDGGIQSNQFFKNTNQLILNYSNCSIIALKSQDLIFMVTRGT